MFDKEKKKLIRKAEMGLSYNDLGRMRAGMEQVMYTQLITKGEDLEEQITSLNTTVERVIMKVENTGRTVNELNLRTYQFSPPSFWAGMLLGSTMTTVSWLMWRIYG